jgi:DeoR/GlpR family transcriptional regulator of sugar metabolism
VNFGPEEIQKIVRLYSREHMTLTAICERFAVSNTTIRKTLKDSGVKLTGNVNRKFS